MADVATKFGPKHILEVEALIERISEPAAVPAATGTPVAMPRGA